MNWLTERIHAAIFPSPAQMDEVEELKSSVEETRGLKHRALGALDAARTQAAVLQQMDRDNHYSESLTKAIRGRF